MGEHIKSHYFTIVRIILIAGFSISGFFYMTERETGVSVLILLLVSFFFADMALLVLNEIPPEEAVGSLRMDRAARTVREQKEARKKRIRDIALFTVGACISCALITIGGKGFLLLAFYLIYEAFACFKVPAYAYFLPFILVFIPSPFGILTLLLVLFMMTICYLQQVFVVAPYQRQIREETVLEQKLKATMENREQASKEELKKNMLAASNKILEERSNLAQALHDKLGHNINGSIYQLEAIKVLMDRDPEKSRQMTQDVIDQLRTGMDEIRAILRKERPERKDLALLQLYKLCEDCNEKGVETDLETDGDMTRIPDKLWEVILDNAFEAVSNSMKYSKCKNLWITLKVMNKFVRCCVRDDGVGCPGFNGGREFGNADGSDGVSEGMGISGMRMRVRAVGGTIDFETTSGFSVNMLLPLGE